MYDGPKGDITFKNCRIAHSGEHGVFIRSDQVNPTETFNINFENTSIVNSANKSIEFAPISLQNTHEPGGITNINFGDNFLIVDDKDRSPLSASYFTKLHGLTNVHGKIKVQNPHIQKPDLGKNLQNVTLKFIN